MPAAEGRRTTHQSLCAQPVPDPRTFHLCKLQQSGTSASVDVHQEIVDAAWAAPRATMYTAAAFVGDVRARLRMAARGQLRDAEELVPVRRHPLLWEIKWRQGRTVGHRMYHAEPGGAGGWPGLLGLRFHRKDLSTDDADLISRAQNEEIDVASHRLSGGKIQNWGHTTEGCVACLD